MNTQVRVLTKRNRFLISWGKTDLTYLGLKHAECRSLTDVLHGFLNRVWDFRLELPPYERVDMVPLTGRKSRQDRDREKKTGTTAKGTQSTTARVSRGETPSGIEKEGAML